MRKSFYRFLSAAVFGVLYIYTALIVLIVLPFAYLQLRSIVKSIVHFWARSVFWILGKKIRISGIEKYSKNKRYLIVANHASLFDITAIMAICPEVVWFGHSRLTKIPIFNQILKMIHYIPLKEKKYVNTKLMLDEIIEKSKQHTIAIFPEGTRTLTGKIHKFYRGFAYILRASEIEILPVTLNGFFVLKPKNRSFIDFSANLSAVIHDPVHSRDLISETDQEIVNRIKAIIESNYINQEN